MLIEGLAEGDTELSDLEVVPDWTDQGTATTCRNSEERFPRLRKRVRIGTRATTMIDNHRRQIAGIDQLAQSRGDRLGSGRGSILAKEQPPDLSCSQVRMHAERFEQPL